MSISNQYLLIILKKQIYHNVNDRLTIFVIRKLFISLFCMIFLQFGSIILDNIQKEMKSNNSISNEYSVLRSFHSHDWMHTKGDYPQILVNRRNNSKVYVIPLSRSSTVEDFQQYQFRSLHSNYLVRVYDIVKTQCIYTQRSPKYSPSIYSVLIECAIARMDHPQLQLTIQEGFYAILGIVKAYGLLHSFCQLFQITNRMVWINEEGRIKLWYNENILSNSVQYPTTTKIQQKNQTIKGYKQKKSANNTDKSKIVGIILKIIQIVIDKMNLKGKEGLAMRIKQYVEKCTSMSQASSVIQQFCKNNSIYIPKFINKRHLPYHPDHKNPYHLNENGQYVCPRQETLVQTKKYNMEDKKFSQYQKPKPGHRLTFLNPQTRSPTPLPFQERYSMGSPTLRDLQQAKRQLRLQKLRLMKQSHNVNEISIKNKKLLTEVKTPKHFNKKIETSSATKKNTNSLQNQQQYSSNKLVQKYIKNRINDGVNDHTHVKNTNYNDDIYSNINSKHLSEKYLKMHLEDNQITKTCATFQSKFDNQTPKNIYSKKEEPRKTIQQSQILDKTVHKKTHTEETHDMWSFRSNTVGDENIHSFFQEIIHKYKPAQQEKNKIIDKEIINTYLRQKKFNLANVEILDQAPPLLIRQSTDREDARTFMDELDFSDQFDDRGSRINVLVQESEEDQSQSTQSPIKKPVLYRANSFVNQAIESKVDEMQHPTDLQRKLNQIKMEDLMKQRKLRQARENQTHQFKYQQSNLYSTDYPKRQIKPEINLPSKYERAKLAHTDNMYRYQKQPKQKDLYNIDEKYNKYVVNKEGAISYEGNQKITAKYYKPINFCDLNFTSQKYKKNNNF